MPGLDSVGLGRLDKDRTLYNVTYSLHMPQFCMSMIDECHKMWWAAFGYILSIFVHGGENSKLGALNSEPTYIC